MITPDGMKNTSRRWDLQLEVGPPIGDLTSNQRSHLQLEISPPIGGPTSWRYFLYHLGWSQYLITSRISPLWIGSSDDTCWTVRCWTAINKLGCHLDPSQLWNVWIDLYKEILEAQSTSLASSDEFEFWSKMFWYLVVGDMEGPQLIELK